MSQTTLEPRIDIETPRQRSAYTYGNRRELDSWANVAPQPEVQAKPGVKLKSNVTVKRRRKPSIVAQVCQFSLVMGALYAAGVGVTTLAGSVALRLAQHQGENSSKRAEAFNKEATRLTDQISDAQRQRNLEKWAEMDQMEKASPSEIVAGVAAPAPAVTQVASLQGDGAGVDVDVKVNRIEANGTH